MSDTLIPPSAQPEWVLTNGRVLLNALQGRSLELWNDVFGRALSQVFAEYAYPQFDLNTGRADSGLLLLDSPQGRIEVAFRRSGIEIAELASKRLLEKKTELNDLLRSAGRPSQTGAKLELIFAGSGLAQKLVTSTPSQAYIRSFDLSRIWPLVGHRIATTIFYDEATTPPEWLQWTRLLLARFLSHCRLPSAHLIQAQLHELSLSLHQLRGGQVALVERVSKEGIVDAPTSARTRCANSVLAFSGYTNDLLSAVDAGATTWLNGGTIAGAVMPPATQSSLEVPLGLQAYLSPNAYLAYKAELLRQFDATLLSYGALAGIEQLLRAIATQTGVTHLASSMRPMPVVDWISEPALALPVSLKERLENLFSSDSENLRNRAMHGAVLETASKQLESALTVPNSTISETFEHLSSGPDMPSNLAQHFLSVLQDLESHAAGRGLGAADLAWMYPLWITPSHVALGQSIYRQTVGDLESAQEQGARLSMFIATSLPIFAKHRLFGSLGQYVKSNIHEKLILSLSWGVMFEGSYRLVAYMHGSNVIQRSPRGRDQRQFQYRMLDTRSGGLCDDSTLTTLTSALPLEERRWAKELLLIAIKLRNAFSHGAVPSYSVAEHQSVGHIYMKATTLLVGAAIHKMTAVGAFYEWERRSDDTGNALEDWLKAEMLILEQFRETSKRRFTLPSGETLVPSGKY